LMKIGDLVIIKWNFATFETDYVLHKRKIGMVVEIEEKFFKGRDDCYDRITVLWTSGKITKEPVSYLSVLYGNSVKNA